MEQKRSLLSLPIGLAIGATLTLLVWIALNLARMHEPLANETAFWCQFTDHKRSWAEEMPSPKIILVGASNVVYGIRAELLQRELNIPVVNLGLIAPLGPDIILNVAESVSHPGDIVVLSLEHFFFEPKYVDGISKTRSLFTCNTNAFFKLPIGEQIKQIFAQPVGETFEGLMRRLSSMVGISLGLSPIQKYNFRIKRGLNGDAYYTRPRDMEMEETVRKTAAGPNFDFSEYSIGAKSVINFVSWAEAHGVKVVVSWPSVYWPQNEQARPAFERMKKFYERLDVQVLGEYSDWMTPIDIFYDTNNHLTSVAAEQRTQYLARLLVPVLSGN